LYKIKKHLNINKNTTNRAKRWPTEWEKILVRCSSDRGLIARIHKELKKLSTEQEMIQAISGQMKFEMQKYKWSVNT
jgi:hypothetical protein